MSWRQAGLPLLSVAKLFRVWWDDVNQSLSSLAYCELYCSFAAIALRALPHMALYETTIEDVKYHHDEFISAPAPTSKGVRAVIVEQPEC